MCIDNVRSVHNGMVIILPGSSATKHVEDVHTAVKRSLLATKSIDDPTRHRMFQTEGTWWIYCGDCINIQSGLGYQVHDATISLRTCVPRPHLEQVSLLLGLVLVTFVISRIRVQLDTSINFFYLHMFHEHHLRLSLLSFAYGWPTRGQGKKGSNWLCLHGTWYRKQVYYCKLISLL